MEQDPLYLIKRDPTYVPHKARLDKFLLCLFIDRQIYSILTCYYHCFGVWPIPNYTMVYSWLHARDYSFWCYRIWGLKPSHETKLWVINFLTVLPSIQFLWFFVTTSKPFFFFVNYLKYLTSLNIWNARHSMD